MYFIVSGVKIFFLAKQENLRLPVTNQVQGIYNIKAADLEAIGAMKVELMLRRTEWRDYYDIYSILKERKIIKTTMGKNVDIILIITQNHNNDTTFYRSSNGKKL